MIGLSGEWDIIHKLKVGCLLDWHFLWYNGTHYTAQDGGLVFATINRLDEHLQRLCDTLSYRI